MLIEVRRRRVCVCSFIEVRRRRMGNVTVIIFFIKKKHTTEKSRHHRHVHDFTSERRVNWDPNFETSRDCRSSTMSSFMSKLPMLLNERVRSVNEIILAQNSNAWTLATVLLTLVRWGMSQGKECKFGGDSWGYLGIGHGPPLMSHLMAGREWDVMRKATRRRR